MNDGTAVSTPTGGITIAVIATEASGDRLGGALMRALRGRAEGVRFIGLGGPEMVAQGLRTLFPIDELAIVGIGAILARAPSLLRHLRDATDAVVAASPDILVIIDSPEFTHRVAKRVRRRIPGLPVVDYVSPSVWAWRPGRAKAMRSYVDHVLALLPFEPAVHERLGGPPCSYVGHPLAEQAALLRPSPAEADRRRTDPPVVLLLPGSRRGELRRHAAVFGEALDLLKRRCGDIEAVLPAPAHLVSLVREATAAWPVRVRIAETAEEKWAAFRSARVALAASGTVTLELAIAGVPTVVAYRVSPAEALIARVLIRVPSIVLANLVLGENVMPELIQGDATPPRLAEATAVLLHDTPERQRQLEAFARLDTVMEIGTAHPSARAADIVLDLLGRAGPRAGNR